MLRLNRFARQNWLLLSVFSVALLVAGWFAFKFIANFIFFHDPRNQDGALKGWMTPHFIIMMYDLPPPTVREILELPKGETRGQRLKEIADELGLTMDELTERVRQEAAVFRSTQQ